MNPHSAELRDIDLERLFSPRLIAVIGASEDPTRSQTQMWRRIRSWADDNKATIFPVNPRRQEIDGITCYPTIHDVPGDIDLVVILVHDAVEAFRAVADRGARFAMIFAAGFAESGRDGRRLQAQLERLIAASNVHLLGPNTNLNAFEQPRKDLPGHRVALASQSGHEGRPIFEGQEFGVPIAYWAPTGNEADLEVADFIAWYSKQPNVGAIAVYLEGLKNGRAFMQAADQAIGRRVPIVAIKVGRTGVGRAAAVSHTAHLAGRDEITSAVFRQFGVTRVDDLDELLEVSATFARLGPPVGGDGICVYSMSGASAAHVADLLAAAGVPLPKFAPATRDRIRQWIDPFLGVANPLDNGATPILDSRNQQILQAILADHNISGVVCPITGVVPVLTDKLVSDLVETSTKSDKPIFVIWSSPLVDHPAYREATRSPRLLVFRSVTSCVRAVQAYFAFHSFSQRYTSPFSHVDKGRARKTLSASLREQLIDRESLSEHDSKQLLKAYNIPLAAEQLCTSPQEATRAATKIGYPVVMKACGPGLAHKSDLGLVRTEVRSASAARAAYGDLMDRAAAAGYPALDGVLVCETVRGDVETVVGITTDEVFGPVVMFGIGGVWVEVLRDVTFRVPPFGLEEARRMMAELRGYPLLTGARGGRRVDLGAVARVIHKVQRIAVDLAESLVELDINPLTLGSGGPVALDAMAVMAHRPRTMEKKWTHTRT